MKLTALTLAAALLLPALNSCTLTFVLGSEEEDVCYDGTWSGVTSQGYPVEFEVYNNEITSVTIDYEVVWGRSGTVTSFTYVADGCSSCDGDPIPIQDGQFSVGFDLPYGAYCSLSGTFSSGYASGGSLVVADDYYTDDLVISWSADLY